MVRYMIFCFEFISLMDVHMFFNFIFYIVKYRVILKLSIAGPPLRITQWVLFQSVAINW
jgi:hypothetical protein